MSSDDSIPVQLASVGTITPLCDAIHSQSSDVLNAVASDPVLPEDLALGLLQRLDLTPETLERVGKNTSVMKSRKVKLALIRHPKTPRHVTVPLVRHLFTFDLMQVALMPTVPADVKVAADEVLINRLETVSIGERLSLAHRGSSRIAGTLLRDAETRVMCAALDNPRLTESLIVRAVNSHPARPAFIEALCRHSKWSLRLEIRMALLRNDKTPLAKALEFVRALPAAQVREIMNGSHLPSNIRAYIEKELEKSR